MVRPAKKSLGLEKVMSDQFSCAGQICKINELCTIRNIAGSLTGTCHINDNPTITRYLESTARNQPAASAALLPKVCVRGPPYNGMREDIDAALSKITSHDCSFFTGNPGQHVACFFDENNPILLQVSNDFVHPKCQQIAPPN